MANTFVNVIPERVKHIMEVMDKSYPDRIIVLSKPTKIETYAPTKRRNTHKIKIEIELATDAFKEDNAIIDFGSIAMLHIDKRHIKPGFLKE